MSCCKVRPADRGGGPEAIQVHIACDVQATNPDVIPGRKYAEIYIQTRVKQATLTTERIEMVVDQTRKKKNYFLKKYCSLCCVNAMIFRLQVGLKMM
jgi:hypothetical protein